MINKNSDASVSVNNDEAREEAFKKISRLCLFFEANGRDDYQKILSFLPTVKSEDRKVKAVAFCRGKWAESLPGDGEVQLFGKKDFNLFNQKKASLKEWLAIHEFDLLICFAEDYRDKKELIIKDINTKVTVGHNFSGPGKYFDISIGKPGEKMNFDEFYNQVKHYISQLNINLDL